MSDPRPSYSKDDVLSQEEVRAALPTMGDSTWLGVSARIPWSTQLGPRKLCIAWGRLLAWLEESERHAA
jgi:hypothetical protein